jgi:multimeric flavodoxin WrbA
MAKILAVSGSLRKDGNTDTLLRRAAAGAESAGADVEVVFLREGTINPCLGCEGCAGLGHCARWNDSMAQLYGKLNACQGLILASPVHNYNISCILKAFIDRLYPLYIASDDYPRKFSSRFAGKGKKAAIFAVGEQQSSSDMKLTLPAMALPLQALGYFVVRRKLFKGLFEKDAAAHDEKSLKAAFNVGKQLAEELQT